MFGKNNKSMPAPHDDLLAGDIYVSKNGKEYEVDMIRNEQTIVGSPATCRD